VVSTSFEGTNEPAGEPCAEQGGTSFEVEGSGVKRYACNGVAGANGQPWTPNGTLPAGATETGTWSYFSTDRSPESIAFAPVSFPIPLVNPLDSAHVVIAPEPTHCPGTSTEPKAQSGYLCIYGTGGVLYGEFVGVESQIHGSSGSGGTTKAGTTLKFIAWGEEAAEEADTHGNVPTGLPTVPEGLGTFAVTG
jgi:hypothetical protein